MNQKIQKIIHQIWVGPKPAPFKWMDTWKKMNPGWDYILWDNKKVFDKRRKWRNQWMIDEYIKRYKEMVKGKNEDGRDVFVSAQGAKFTGDKATYFAWHVLADVLRYEILYRYGGYMPGSDSECVAPIGNYFGDNDLYIVNTGHLYTDIYEKLQKGRGDLTPEMHKFKLLRYAPENSSPIAACAKGHWFAKALIDELSKLKIKDLGEAVDTTGNVFMGKMIRKYHPESKVAYYLKGGDEFSAETRRSGVGRTTGFSFHHAGTTRGCYRKGEYIERDLVYVIDGKQDPKYSIRSATENIEHRNLVIIGPKPKWAKGVVHIKCEDLEGEGNQIKNTAKKILKACGDKRVSDNFILMNDDFYVMKPWEPEWLHKDTLRKSVRAARKRGISGGYHQKAQVETIVLLGKKAIDYSVHAPCEINKQKMLDVESKYKISSGKYLTRTVYGNECEVKGVRSPQIKTQEYDREEMALLSTIDRVEDKEEFKRYIREKFPNKSKYEK